MARVAWCHVDLHTHNRYMACLHHSLLSPVLLMHRIAQEFATLVEQ